MALHLIKLCVGVSEIEEMNSWVKISKKSQDDCGHVTRMFPRRKDEILAGGSLYWVIRGLILCRQPIADLQEVTGLDGIRRCRIIFKPQIIEVRPTPRRAFQGWRYLTEDDAPIDLPRGEKGSDLPDKMRRELVDLGLI
jgi:hypothetical protein